PKGGQAREATRNVLQVPRGRVDSRRVVRTEVGHAVRGWSPGAPSRPTMTAASVMYKPSLTAAFVLVNGHIGSIQNTASRTMKQNPTVVADRVMNGITRRVLIGLFCLALAGGPMSQWDRAARDGFAADRDGGFNAGRCLGYLNELCKLGPRISATPAMALQQARLQKHF